MTATLNINFAGTRLVRLLSEFTESTPRLSQQQTAERLDSLIDFSGSLTLVDMHKSLPSIEFEPAPFPFEEVQEAFLRNRLLIVQNIIRSLVPGAGKSRIKLPVITSRTPLAEAMDYTPFNRFYAAHQGEMEKRVRMMRMEVRDALSGTSFELAQLAELDRVLEETLAVHTRRFFAIIMRLLEKRFKQRLAEHQQKLEDPSQDDPGNWYKPGNWLESFCVEMRELLLAELEVRLMPVVGMIEALNEEVQKKQ